MVNMTKVYRLNVSKGKIKTQAKANNCGNACPYEPTSNEALFFQWVRNRRYAYEGRSYDRELGQIPIHAFNYVGTAKTKYGAVHHDAGKSVYQYGSDPEIDQFVTDECQCPICRGEGPTDAQISKYEESWAEDVFNSFIPDGDKPSQYTKIYPSEKDWADHKAKEISQAMAWGDNPQGVLAGALRDAFKQGEDMSYWSNAYKPIKTEDLIRDSEERGKAFAARVLKDAKIKAMIHKRREPIFHPDDGLGEMP